MNLAARLLLFPLLASLPGLPTSAPGMSTEAQQSSSKESSPQTPATSQGTTPGARKTDSGSKKATATHRRRVKKKSTGSPCLASSPKASAPRSDSETSTSSSAQHGQDAAAPSRTATDCPPPKIVVRQGGSDEPSIQLAGGPTAHEATQQRDVIIQLLGTAEENLKKTAEMQLSPAQQDTISQTRQFMEQSKTAMANGDLERAHTLAWKAQLLSADLVNPQK